MKLQFAKEVKHSVVYEVTPDTPPAAVLTRSIYITKAWLATHPSKVNDPSGWPVEIELEGRVVG